MTACIIIGCILLFIVLILLISPTLYVRIADEVSLKVGALGIKISVFPQKEKKNKDKKPKPKKEKKKKSTKKQEQTKKLDKKPNEKTFGDTVDLIFTVAKSVLGSTAKMLKHLRFTDLDLMVAVGGDSADETAIAYGRMCAAVFPVIGAIDSMAKLKVKRVAVCPNFLLEDTKYDISFQVKLRIVWFLKAALGIFLKIIVNTMKKSVNKPTNNKKAVQ